MRILGNSLLLAVTVTGASIALAVPLVWLLVRTDLPGRRFWTVALVLPLVIPSYVGAFTLLAMFGPRGILQGWLEPLGVQRLPEIYGFFGAWLISDPVHLPLRAADRTGDAGGGWTPVWRKPGAVWDMDHGASSGASPGRSCDRPSRLAACWSPSTR